jgi:hypothetical protein
LENRQETNIRSFSSNKSPPSGENKSNETKQYSNVGIDDRLSNCGQKHQEPQEQQLTLLLLLPAPQQQEEQQMEMEGLPQELRNVATDIATVEKRIDIVEQDIEKKVFCSSKRSCPTVVDLSTPTPEATVVRDIRRWSVGLFKLSKIKLKHTTELLHKSLLLTLEISNSRDSSKMVTSLHSNEDKTLLCC